MKTILAGIIGLASLGLTGCGNECSEAAEKLRKCCGVEPDAEAKSICAQVAQALEERGENCDPDHVICSTESE
jgi:hypothetical protein